MTFRSLRVQWIGIVLMLTATTASAQHRGTTKPKGKSPEPAMVVRSLQLIGIRPGISFDSVRKALASGGGSMREVQLDTLSHSFPDKALHIYVVDSLICRLTYMRMVFVFDEASHHLRRFAITPRESSVAAGQNDDIDAALLLYFGEGWGKPEILFDPPAAFTWRSGNIEMRGFIKRGYSLWVMEG